MTHFFHWWAGHKALVMLSLAVLGLYANHAHYQAIRDGRCKRDDLGYFWRLWRAGDPLGTRVMWSSFLALALGACYIVSIVMVS